ncbi:MAG: ATP-binding protein [Ectothiorhodospiraceae bacterium]|nr:ATP-binding protein [Ectothiorhodospiraceae bacterium]MCH8504824.1 ATP-binding protein [Ectothiorhodospiraceae bacterium]
MAEDFGQIQTIPHDRETESLKLSFWPGSVPLQQRWRNNGLSADFLGDYVTTFFPLDENDPATKRRQDEIRGAVSFVANELLENAMKFHDESLPEPITVELYLQRQQIVIQESNAANAARADEFRTFVRRLRESDPTELYISQIEENAMSDTTAGLGYLTMINDYQAELAWRFETVADAGFRVTTQVTIKI